MGTEFETLDDAVGAPLPLRVVDVSAFRFCWHERMEGEAAGVVVLCFENGAVGAFRIHGMTQNPV